MNKISNTTAMEKNHNRPTITPSGNFSYKGKDSLRTIVFVQTFVKEQGVYSLGRRIYGKN